MRKNRIIIALVLSISLFAGTFFAINANADETVVSGTVAVGSNASILKFDTSGGQMLIKLDGDTNYSDGKVLLPGRELTISLAYGSDAYMHAKKITDGKGNIGVTVDRNNTTNVSGYIKDCKTTDIIYFQTSAGDMEIKMDASTSLSDCVALVPGSYYTIEVGRGSDAYMHAIAVKDATRPSNSVAPVQTADVSNSITLGNGTSVAAANTTVSGTVGSKSTSSMLYLDTSSGQMQIKLDCVTGVAVLVSGQKVTCKVGYGSDGYWHARVFN